MTTNVHERFTTEVEGPRFGTHKLATKLHADTKGKSFSVGAALSGFELSCECQRRMKVVAGTGAVIVTKFGLSMSPKLFHGDEQILNVLSGVLCKTERGNVIVSPPVMIEKRMQVANGQQRQIVIHLPAPSNDSVWFLREADRLYFIEVELINNEAETVNVNAFVSFDESGGNDEGGKDDGSADGTDNEADQKPKAKQPELVESVEPIKS